MDDRRIHLALLVAVLAVFAWSAVAPHDRVTWVLEVFPVAIGLALLLPTYAKFRLTGLLYAGLALHAVVLMVGGKYTYAEVPWFNALRDALELTRNPYDRLGHFLQGFVPALLVRELLLRTSPLRPGRWLFAIVAFACLGFSALYELIEWTAAVALGQGAEAFLGMQGDVWDTQKDMALALLGALASQLLLGRAHDRALARIGAVASGRP